MLHKLAIAFAHWLMFGPIMFFAAGSSALGDAGGSYDAGVGDLSADTGGAGEGAGEGDGAGGEEAGTAELDADGAGEPRARTDVPKPKIEEDPDAKEFGTLVGRRILNMVKAAPELREVFKAHPDIQASIEAGFRERAAYKEQWPTIAEARQMRETFPNGLADVQTLQASVQELEALDADFYNPDAQGNYSGHSKILSEMHQSDPKAAVAFFKGLPKEWARLDRDSYNEVMGGIVGATLAQKDIGGFLEEMIEEAKTAKQDALAGKLGKLLGWVDSFNKTKPQPTEAERALSEREARLTKEESQRAERTQGQFHQSFVAESKKVQIAAIKLHPAVKRTLEAQAIPDAKKQEIVEQIRKAGEQMLGKSPSFMAKLRPAHKSGNLQETINLQKAAWFDQRLMNMIVRRILAKETPQLVAQNRDSIRRRAGTPAKPAAKAGAERTAPKGPHQVGGRWYKADGTPFSTAEVVSGKHLQA